MKGSAAGAQLRPVLREQEFRQFDLARAVETLRQIKLAVRP